MISRRGFEPRGVPVVLGGVHVSLNQEEARQHATRKRPTSRQSATAALTGLQLGWGRALMALRLNLAQRRNWPYGTFGAAVPVRDGDESCAARH